MWGALRKDLSEFATTMAAETTNALNTINDNLASSSAGVDGELDPDGTSSSDNNQSGHVVDGIFIPGSGGGKEIAIMTVEEIVSRKQIDEKTYTEPLSGEEAEEEDAKSFSIEDKTDHIAHLLETVPAVKEHFERLVPLRVGYQEFWQRYFVRCSSSRASREREGGRREVQSNRQSVLYNLRGSVASSVTSGLKAVVKVVEGFDNDVNGEKAGVDINDEDDDDEGGGWDDDDEDEEVLLAQDTQPPPPPSTIAVATAKVAEDARLKIAELESKLKDEQESHLSQVDTLKSEIEQLKSDIEHLKSSSESAAKESSSLGGLNQEIDALKRSLAAADVSLEEERARSKKALSSKNDEVAALRNEVSTLTDAAVAAVASATNDAELAEKLQTLERENLSLKAALEEKATIDMNLEEAVRENSSLKASIAGEVTRFTDHKKESAQMISSLQAEERKNNETIIDMQSEIQALKSQVEEAKSTALSAGDENSLLREKDKISEEEKSMLKQQIEELSNKLLANSDITASNSESSSLVKIGADEATKSEEVDEGGKTPSEEDDVNVVEDGGDGWGSDDGWGDDL